MLKLKNKLIAISVAILLSCTIFVCIVTGCNKDLIDTVYSYDYAIIELPNGQVIAGHVDSWRDYEDGDQLQVTIDGTTYLVHSSRCVLMNTK